MYTVHTPTSRTTNNEVHSLRIIAKSVWPSFVTFSVSPTLNLSSLELPNASFHSFACRSRGVGFPTLGDLTTTEAENRVVSVSATASNKTFCCPTPPNTRPSAASSFGGPVFASYRPASSSIPSLSALRSPVNSHRLTNPPSSSSCSPSSSSSPGVRSGEGRIALVSAHSSTPSRTTIKSSLPCAPAPCGTNRTVSQTARNGHCILSSSLDSHHVCGTRDDANPPLEAYAYANAITLKQALLAFVVTVSRESLFFSSSARFAIDSSDFSPTR
mmetsp:Transcript_12808/g.27929  ORF Transcript_12808/g.27929 Transcript_12808/m.27929 type:complete len:272 (+) Transcript_12808:1851-2666(+)